MGLMKRLKKKAKQVLKIANPIMGKKIGNSIFGEDKKPGPVDPGLDVFGQRKQNDEYYQNDLADQQKTFSGALDSQRAASIEDAKAAGTYSDSREFAAGNEAEAGARAKGIQSTSLKRINLLRKQLGLPESSSAM